MKNQKRPPWSWRGLRGWRRKYALIVGVGVAHTGRNLHWAAAAVAAVSGTRQCPRAAQTGPM